MKRVILADSQELFRAGVARTIAQWDEFRIVAQGSDPERLLNIIPKFPGCIVIVAASLGVDPERFKACLAESGSRGVVIAESGMSVRPFAETFHGVVSRHIAPGALIECLRQVAEGNRWVSTALAGKEVQAEDPVGIRVRARLTKKEMNIAALLVQGCKNREIAYRLNTTEQVIKNYLRSVYDKTGVGDRLELVLFILHHKQLAIAIDESLEESERQVRMPVLAVA